MKSSTASPEFIYLLFIANPDHNNLTGTIPSELSAAKSLTLLSFQGNGLTGTIPSELGSLPILETLWIPENSLTGPIPD